jgi:hypothetical protein
VKMRLIFVSALLLVCAACSKQAELKTAAQIPVIAPELDEPSAIPDFKVPSADAKRVIDWIASAGDNTALPYAVIDKQNARIFLFNAKGRDLGSAPILIGIKLGDTSSPGVGSKSLSKIGPAEKTTPAGRFLSRYGVAAGGQKVLWVDYDNSVALHAVITDNKKEQRLKRLTTPEAADNRITFGCINVPTHFYKKGVEALFKKRGGMVYILPDTKSLETVFPRLMVQPYLAQRTD